MRKVRRFQSLCPTAAAVQGQGQGQGQGCVAGSFEAGAGVGGSRTSASTARPRPPAPGPGWGPGGRRSQRTNARLSTGPHCLPRHKANRGEKNTKTARLQPSAPQGGFSFSSNLGRSQANRDSVTERFATKIIRAEIPPLPLRRPDPATPEPAGQQEEPRLGLGHGHGHTGWGHAATHLACGPPCHAALQPGSAFSGLQAIF